MQQRLPNHRTDLGVTGVRIGRNYFIAQLTAESSLGSGAFEPSRYLAGVVGAPSSSVESAVPKFRLNGISMMNDGAMMENIVVR